MLYRTTQRYGLLHAGPVLSELEANRCFCYICFTNSVWNSSCHIASTRWGQNSIFFFSHPLQQASPWLGQCEIVEEFCSNLFLNVYENDKNEAPKYAKKMCLEFRKWDWFKSDHVAKVLFSELLESVPAQLFFFSPEKVLCDSTACIPSFHSRNIYWISFWLDLIEFIKV